MIDLPAEHLAMVLAVLALHVPGVEVRAFGSRVTGRAKPWSDLDLVLMNEQPLPVPVIAALRSAFDESDLPIRVDVVEWARLEPGFRQVIEAAWEPVPPLVRE